jgi:transposase InsO family protein
VILAAIAEAQAAGARLDVACRVVGLTARTVQRWRARPGGEDQRLGPRHRPQNALSSAEQAQILALMTSPRFAGLSPKQLVPQLADEGVYVASESTMYRLQHRCELRRPQRPAERTHVTRAAAVHSATGPNRVWSWDITYLPTTTRGRFLRLYLVIDVWSRRIMGWDVHERESAEHAAALVRRICDEDGVDPKGLVLHSDNGKAMRGSTMLATLQWLGVVPSFSRPHVCNDNPYSEALFRTLKHVPAYPQLFAGVDTAHRWVSRFVAWYNGEHRHSGIRFVTPNDRHFGRERSILAARHAVYQRARRRRPERWSGPTRDWSPVGTVLLNPDPALRSQLSA